MGKKRKANDANDEYEYDPIPQHMVTAHLKNQEKRLIVILEGAQLETVKVCSLFQVNLHKMSCLHIVFRWETNLNY